LLGSRKPTATGAPGPTRAKNLLHFGCYHQQKLAGVEEKGTGPELELQMQTWTNVITYLPLELLIFFKLDSFVFVLSSVTATLKHTFMEKQE
jgi:hypothetical protein